METSYLQETNLTFRLFPIQIWLMKDLLEPIIEPTSKKDKVSCGNHHERIMGIRDAIDVLSGKWKVQIIGTLLFDGKKRFMDLLRDVDGIAAKMLSKELQDLEAHQLVKRTVMETKPITVEYEITPYGRSLEDIIIGIANWGVDHRRKIMTPEQ